MPIKTIKKNRFDLGMTDKSERDIPEGAFHYLENVEVTPRGIKQVADATASDSTRKILKSLSLSNGNIYALGGGTTNYGIAKWNGTTWAVNDATTVAYAKVTNPFFVYHKNYIWFAEGTWIGYYYLGDDSIGDKWINPTVALKGGVMWQGYAYGWSEYTSGINTFNDIYKVDINWGSAGFTNMLTIPGDQQVVDIIPYGNLLAILTTGVISSKMYLWDGVTTTTFYDIVEIGVGNVIGGCIKDGAITIIVNSLNGKTFEIKQYAGTGFSTPFNYSGRKNNSGTVNTYIISKVKKSGNYIYFIGSVTRGDSTDTKANVLFRWGNKEAGDPNYLCVYKNLNFASATLSGYSQEMNDFIILDDVNASTDYVSVFATLQDTTTPAIKEVKTDGTFDNDEGVIETGIITGDDSNIVKQFNKLTVKYAPLTTGQSVVVKMKRDADTSWTTIATRNTVGEISREIGNVEATGAIIAPAKEWQFRIELLGGAEFTGYELELETEI
jgi:hypothetical protein